MVALLKEMHSNRMHIKFNGQHVSAVYMQACSIMKADKCYTNSKYARAMYFQHTHEK